MKKIFLITGLLTLTVTSASAMEDHSMHMKQHTAHHTEDEAPIGIMGAHSHPKGKFMLSYQYKTMDMDGVKQGTNSITSATVRTNYMVAPINMQMNMHMFGGMYGLTDDITIMGMVPYMYKQMEMERADLSRFQRNSNGIGDIKLSAIKKIHQKDKASLHASLGVSLPTGSIDEEYDGSRLGYSMQNGSGTTDILGTITYTDIITDKSSWGTQANVTLRAGLNDNGYRKGNEYKSTSWISRKFTNNFGASLIFDASYAEKITGSDATLNTAMMPSSNSVNYGGTKAILGTELNYSGFAGHLISLRFDAPIYENLKGTQGKQSYSLAVGWKKRFHD